MRVCPKCGKQYAPEVGYCETDGTLLTDLDAPLTQSDLNGPRPGTVLGSYRLDRLLGIGGMGFVYLAEHTRLGRKVALKMLRGEYATNADLVRRFFGEARAVNQIRHENIVQITDFIEQPGGDNYYIMELLEGANLGHLLNDHGAMPIERCLKIAMQVASALGAVHAADIIHRDLKSENIFLIELGGQKDFVKLLDFGLAKLMGPTESKPTHQTAEGVILGTPEYMSPEQAAGKKVDHRADNYALGVILYEMVTGRKPFTGDDFGQVAIQQITTKPTRPSKLKDPVVRVPKRFEKLVMDLLEKDPANRPQTMQDVIDALREIARVESVPLGSFIADAAYKPSRVGFYAALTFLVLGLTGGSLAWVWYQDEQDRLATEAAKNKNPTGPPQVQVILESVPAGAEVKRMRDGEAVGITPVRVHEARSDRIEQYQFKLDGHKPVLQKVAMADDKRLVVMLAKKPEPVSPKFPPASGQPKNGVKPPGVEDETPDAKPDPEATLDPFAETK